MPENSLIIETVANGWVIRSPRWGESCTNTTGIYVFESMAAVQLALPALIETPKFLKNPMLDQSVHEDPGL